MKQIFTVLILLATGMLFAQSTSVASKSQSSQKEGTEQARTVPYDYSRTLNLDNSTKADLLERFQSTQHKLQFERVSKNVPELTLSGLYFEGVWVDGKYVIKRIVYKEN